MKFVLVCAFVVVAVVNSSGAGPNCLNYDERCTDTSPLCCERGRINVRNPNISQFDDMFERARLHYLWCNPEKDSCEERKAGAFAIFKKSHYDDFLKNTNEGRETPLTFDLQLVTKARFDGESCKTKNDNNPSVYGNDTLVYANNDTDWTTTLRSEGIQRPMLKSALNQWKKKAGGPLFSYNKVGCAIVYCHNICDAGEEPGCPEKYHAGTLLVCHFGEPNSDDPKALGHH